MSQCRLIYWSTGTNVSEELTASILHWRWRPGSSKMVIPIYQCIQHQIFINTAVRTSNLAHYKCLKISASMTQYPAIFLKITMRIQCQPFWIRNWCHKIPGSQKFITTNLQMIQTLYRLQQSPIAFVWWHLLVQVYHLCALIHSTQLLWLCCGTLFHSSIHSKQCSRAEEK